MNPQYYGAAAEYNKPKGPKLLSPKVLMIAGGALAGLLLLMVLLAVISTLASGPRTEVARLAARSQQLQSFLDQNLKSVRHPDILKVAAEAKLFNGTSSLAVTKAYSSELPESVVDGESDPTIKTKLDAATKAGKYDEVFLEIMTAKVESTLELGKKIQSQGSGPQTQAAVEQTITNMDVISERLAAIQF